MTNSTGVNIKDLPIIVSDKLSCSHIMNLSIGKNIVGCYKSVID